MKSLILDVGCGRTLLQSSLDADLLVVQVLEGEPVTGGTL
jgi:hypothetical protein